MAEIDPNPAPTYDQAEQAAEQSARQSMYPRYVPAVHTGNYQDRMYRLGRAIADPMISTERADAILSAAIRIHKAYTQTAAHDSLIEAWAVRHR
ncbi:hypothetical protein ACXJJ3_26775 [Kribbella sp. WER1]